MFMKVFAMKNVIGGINLESCFYKHNTIFLKKGRCTINEPEEGYS